jgi:hypothetical protein
MSVLGTLTASSSSDDVAEAIILETKRRGYTRDESVAAVSTGIQESRLQMIKHPTRDWWGYFQQDAGYLDRMNPNGNIRGFLDRLDVKRRSPGASQDIWLNIFWLQQRPSEPTADQAFANGRQAYLSEIQRHIAQASELYDRFGDNMWTGDPVWLEDVLRPVLGNRLRTLSGWKTRGHGDFRDIRGVMWHHTGNSLASAGSIRDGRPDLAGPLANLHIAPDGTVTIVAVGVCWHAGVGSYPWLPTNNANWHMIGVECAWPTIRSDGSYDGRERWPDAQIISMRDVAAALTLRLQLGAERNIRHQDYAGSAQGKWDAGNLDTRWFQGEVAKAMRGEFNVPAPPPVPSPVPPPVLPPPPNPRTDRILLEEIWTQLRGVDGNGWPQLGGKTLVDSIGELHRKIDALGDTT